MLTPASACAASVDLAFGWRRANGFRRSTLILLRSVGWIGTSRRKVDRFAEGGGMEGWRDGGKVTERWERRDRAGAWVLYEGEECGQMETTPKWFGTQETRTLRCQRPDLVAGEKVAPMGR
jgi:hypothetical protein